MFPREHIGESLLGMSARLLHELGVWPALERAGFVTKPGAILLWGGSDRRMELDMPRPAFQVLRSEFDSLLLEHARAQGVEVAMPHWVREPLFDATGRIEGVRIQGDDSHPYDVRARVVVDASGLTQFLARRLALKTTLVGPRRLGVGAYYAGASRVPAPLDGDIVSEASSDGWLWFIPLSEGLTSVGFVGDAADFDGDVAGTLDRQIASTSYVRELLRGSARTRPPRVLRYTNHLVDAPLWDRGYVLVGDAAAFVDPLFSTGVHGGLYAAALVGAALSSVLAGEVDEGIAAGWYDRRLRDHYYRIQDTVALLYGIHPGARPFWRRRDLSQMSDDLAELYARRLGALGMAFFVNFSRSGDLRLPTALQDRAHEFVIRPRVRPLPCTARVQIAPEIRATTDWMVHDGRLTPAVRLQHERNRTVSAEYPAASFRGHLIRAVDGNATVSELAGQLTADPRRRAEAPLLLGTLASAGLLTTSGQAA
jgi:halogenation protein CepH